MIEFNNTPIASLDVDNTKLSDELAADNIHGTDYSASHKKKAVTTITLVSAAALTTGGLFTNTFFSTKPQIDSSYRFYVKEDSVGYDFTISQNKKFDIYFNFYEDTSILLKSIDVSKNQEYRSGSDGCPSFEGLKKNYRHRIRIFYTNHSDMTADLLDFSFFTNDYEEGFVFDKSVVDNIKKAKI